jgi:hypothetical protein
MREARASNLSGAATRGLRSLGPEASAASEARLAAAAFHRPRAPGLPPLSYWRRPVWPVLAPWRSLVPVGANGRADALRGAALQELSGEGFAEYNEPFTGEQLGSDARSWAAAVALDWLAADGAA